MTTKNKIKVLLPNLLTASRLILTPFIIALGITNHFKMVIILIVIAALTDMLDGKVARYFHTVSDFGAKLDTVSDKVFAIGLSLAILTKYNQILPIIILEIIIALMNVYFYYKLGEVKSLMIGKIKTTFLFITIIAVYLFILISKLSFINIILTGLVYATINLQLLSIVFYIRYNLNKDKDVPIKENISEDKLEKTILVENIEDLLYEKDYDNDII